MTAAMLTTMVLCFALSVSVAVSIGLAVDPRHPGHATPTC